MPTRRRAAAAGLLLGDLMHRSARRGVGIGLGVMGVAALLPFVVGGILMMIRPDYIMALFTTDSGRMILGIAIVIQCIGLLVIRTMIKKTLE